MSEKGVIENTSCSLYVCHESVTLTCCGTYFGNVSEIAKIVNHDDASYEIFCGVTLKEFCFDF